MSTAPSAPPPQSPPPPDSRPWWRTPALLVPALAVVLAAVLTPLVTAALSPSPSPSGTGSTSAPGGATGTGSTSAPGGATGAGATGAGTSAWTVGWTGAFEITGDGVNFDDQPPGPASADIYYNGTLASNDATTMAIWPHASAPDAASCADWVRTHAENSVYPVTVGMQICLHTLQNRAVLLQVKGVSDPQSQAGISTQVTVWQQP